MKRTDIYNNVCAQLAYVNFQLTKKSISSAGPSRTVGASKDCGPPKDTAAGAARGGEPSRDDAADGAARGGGPPRAAGF